MYIFSVSRFFELLRNQTTQSTSMTDKMIKTSRHQARNNHDNFYGFDKYLEWVSFFVTY